MEYEDLQKLKNNNSKKSIFLILTIILGLGISLAAIYFVYAYRDSRENTLATGLISINFTEDNVISLSNTVPVIDDVGLTNTPYGFSITNTSQVPINAKIMLEIDDDTDINLGAVRYALYINSKLIKIDYVHEDDLTLYTYKNMKQSGTIECELKFWVDYYYETPGETFKAKVKAEGESFDIIVTPPPSMDEMCPNCKFLYITDTLYTTWNTAEYYDDVNDEYIPETPTVLTSSSYSDNYEDVVTSSGYPYFLGVILDNNRISRAFSCGIYNNTTPFCIEGTIDGSKYESNSEYLNEIYGEYDEGTNLGCSEYSDEYTSGVKCYGSVSAGAYVDGYVSVVADSGSCGVDLSGGLSCAIGGDAPK